MYKLSSLPIEILYIIGGYLDTEDIVAIARLNPWFGYWFSILLGERIADLVRQEGWRIHVKNIYHCDPKIYIKLSSCTDRYIGEIISSASDKPFLSILNRNLTIK